MRTKPALKVLLLYVIGLVLGQYLAPPLWGLVALTGLMFLLAFFLSGRESELRWLPMLGTALALVLAALLRFELATGHFSPRHISNFTRFGNPVALSGTVVGYPEPRVNQTNLVVEVDEIYHAGVVHRSEGKIRLSVAEMDRPLRYGDRVIARGRLRAPRGRRNPGEFDYQRYLAAQGIFGVMHVPKSSQVEVQSSGHGNWLLRQVVYPAKAYVERYIRQHLPPTEAALLQGLLLGQRGEIPFELRDAFSRLGVIHILAVSGLHVGFIMLIFLGVLGLLRVPFRVRVYLTLIALLFYAYLTGLKPPVVRAALMGGLVLFGITLERRTDVFNLLGVAALVILLYNPLELFQAGFQLSFAAVASIVYFYPRLRDALRVRKLYERAGQSVLVRYPTELFLASAAAFLGTLPFTILYFNRLPHFSLLANLAVVPLAFCGLATGLAAVLFHLAFPPLGELYVNAAWLFLHLLVSMVEWAGRLPLASQEIFQMSTPYTWFYFAGLILLANFRDPRNRARFAILLLLLANLWVWKTALTERNLLSLTFLDVGQGDAVLVTLPGPRHLLIDAGPRTRTYDAGRWVVVPYLKRAGIERLHALVLSHGDSDHLGGVPYLLRHVPVREVWDNGRPKDTGLYREYLHLLDSLHVRRRILRAGARLDDFAPVQIFVLHPDTLSDDEAVSANEGSLALRISFGQVDFLSAGDIEAFGESQMLRFGSLLNSEVLKVSHHGSRTSSTAEFLDRVEPDLAVISAGEWNKFGHPHAEVLARLRQRAVRVFRTDREGAILLASDGRKVWRVDWR